MRPKVYRPLLAAIAATLSGCNLVYSDRPLFGPEAAEGAQLFKDGLWRAADRDCRFDERRPAETWPDCADWSVVRGGETFERANGDWRRIERTLVAGEPLLSQVRTQGDDGSPIYYFLAFRVVTTDAAGRALAVDSWPVQCGPPPPDGAEGSGTLEPLEGMDMDEAGDACRASSAEAVRRAASPSAQWSESRRYRWVREGWR